MVSFDVISLFMNVLVSLAIEAACQGLQNDGLLSERTMLTVESIIMLLQLYFSAAYLSFRNRYYRQIFGTAMGSPVSATVTNLLKLRRIPYQLLIHSHNFGRNMLMM